ncbi:S9 family peptidase [Propionibacteriaceae bacterium Y1923]
MQPQDIQHLIALSRPAVHPSGEWAVVASSRPDLAANRAVGQLWRINLDDGRATRLTRGVADAAPQLSKDGRLLAFLRADDRDKPQVFVLDPAGGEPVQATAAEGGVDQFAFSPDGDRIAFTSRVAEHGRYGSVEGLGPRDESPRLIEELAYLGNGLGWTRDRRAHLFVAEVPDPHGEPSYRRAPQPGDGLDGVEVPTPEPAVAPATRLSSGDHHHTGPAWTHDGTRVAVITARHDTREHDLLGSLVEFDVAAPDEQPHVVVPASAGLSIHSAITTTAGGYALVAQEMGPTGRDFLARNAGLYLVDSPGEAPRRLTDAETIDLGEVGSHLTEPGEGAGGGILAQFRTRGRVQLARVTATGHDLLTSGDVEVLSHGAGGSRVVGVVATPTSAAELAVIEHGRARVITSFGAALAEAGVVLPSEHEFTARDGSPVHGWVWLPEGPGPHPVLLNIHGGPFAQYGVHVFDEAQVAVAAGYAVVQCNPRGSAGYGQQFGRAIRHAMGSVDATDVLDFLDATLAAHPGLDAERVGVMGGSYGGYLTAWLIAHDHRFTAAIVERGFLDPETFIGTSDIGWYFSEGYTGDDPAQRAAQSPMAVVDQVRTPTLVVHSEEDYRCPLEQAQRYFSALKRRGVQAQLLVFPGENHELTRSGSPRHRVERFEHVMRWWATHLPVAATADAS